MESIKIRYMQLQDENDSPALKATKWQFCGLVTYLAAHPALTDDLIPALNALFDYGQYLIATGQ